MQKIVSYIISLTTLQIPLGCVCIRYVMLALNASEVQAYFSHQSSSSIVLHTLVGFLLLLLVKIAVGVGLVMYASSVREQDANLLLFSPAPTGSTASHAMQNLASPKKNTGIRGVDAFGPEKVGAVNAAAATPSKDTAGTSTAAAVAHATAAAVNQKESSIAKVLFTGEMTESEKIQERIEFMEELSTIERYTVYKGRII